MIQYELAPMEGITNIRFRRFYQEYFGDADRYFTPFLVGKNLSNKEKAEVDLENNKGMKLIPQILTNRAEEFVYVANNLYDVYGYEEVNLNLGCPSGTVANKNRGSGFLRVLPELDVFLDYIYTHSKPAISIKTRIGFQDDQDWERILHMYGQYPLSELIVHPRTRVQGYGGVPNLEAFSRAYDYLEEHARTHTRIPLSYNGNIYTVEDAKRIQERFPKLAAIMCGRGVIENPFLIGACKGKENYSVTANPLLFRQYTDAMYREYKEAGLGERNSLFKLKELWRYWIHNFPESDKKLKAILKANSHLEFEAAVNNAFNMR